MRRLLVLRILLPAALVVFLVLIVIALQPPPQVHRDTAGGPGETSRRAREFRFIELRGDRPVLDFDADLVEEGEDGKVHLENIARFVIDRAERDPLIIRARIGDYEGEAGERILRFDREVELSDPSAGLKLTLPVLVVDEAAGEARCTDEVRFEGPGLRGTGSSLVLSLIHI